MKVFGADFSGARDPSKGIYYAEGFLQENLLKINRVVHCDDRLDLLSAIHFSKAPWGLDFPFSLPVQAQSSLQVNNWGELLDLALDYSRADFERVTGSSITSRCEGRCQSHSICCRVVDASIGSYSPLKKTNPNMRAMTYAGLKLLSYLRSLGNRVYPFDPLDQNLARVYEVYPSYTWSQVELPRSTNVERFTGRFQQRYGFKISFTNSFCHPECIDAADAVVACVTLGYSMYLYGLDQDWSQQHSWIGKNEWEHRFTEGMIVKF